MPVPPCWCQRARSTFAGPPHGSRPDTARVQQGSHTDPPSVGCQPSSHERFADGLPLALKLCLPLPPPAARVALAVAKLSEARARPRQTTGDRRDVFSTALPSHPTPLSSPLVFFSMLLVVSGPFFDPSRGLLHCISVEANFYPTMLVATLASHPDGRQQGCVASRQAAGSSPLDPRWQDVLWQRRLRRSLRASQALARAHGHC